MREVMPLTVRELQHQHKTNSHGTMLSVQNTEKRSLTWCRQRGRWCPNWWENCSPTIKRTGQRSLSWWRRRGRWHPCRWVNCSATKKNSHGTTVSIKNTKKRSLTWCRRRGRWCPCQWENHSATSKTNSHGTTLRNTGKRSLTWCMRKGRWYPRRWENYSATSKTNSHGTTPSEIQGKEVWPGAGGAGGDSTVGERTAMPQVKQTIMGLYLQNTGKRSLTWCRLRGRWCPCRWENCSATSPNTPAGAGSDCIIQSTYPKPWLRLYQSYYRQTKNI